MIYDCFIFNDELDLLELRLKFLDHTVDRFVLVESERTLAGNKKPLHYLQNRDRFAAFNEKIIHIIAPTNELAAWDYESLQRNAVKTGLANCANDDLIFISDVDEIVNIPEIIKHVVAGEPTLVELPMYYYFFNMKTNARFFVNMVAKWSFIKDKDIGHRYGSYEKLVSQKIFSNTLNTGWHFSYLFGYDIPKYQQKITAFSHQEFNTAYYLNAERIRRCVQLGIDIFERPGMTLSVDDSHLAPLLPFIRESNLSHLFYDPSERKMSAKNIIFILHKRFYRKVKYKLQRIFAGRKTGQT